MDKFAVAVMPIADIGAWKEFAEEITTGDRAEGHRQFLRRGNVKAEHVFHQPTPMGDLMVLIWEGVDPEGLAAHFGTLIENPASDHERYLRDYVIPKVHGVDPTAPPPPPAQRIATVTS